MDLYLLRHPSVAVPKGWCYGRTDVALAATFAAELVEIREKLSGLRFDRVISSPSSRCRHTAASLQMGTPVLDPRLQELDFGNWENKSWSQISRQEIQHWSEDLLNRSPPGGESGLAMMKRCGDFWDSVVPNGQKWLLVTHGGWIRATIARVLAIDFNQSFDFPIDYGSLSHFRFEKETWTLVFSNH